MEIAKALGAMLPRPLSRPCLIAAFWTQAVNALQGSFRLESDALRDISQCTNLLVVLVFAGVNARCQSKTGLMGSSDSAANWTI